MKPITELNITDETPDGNIAEHIAAMEALKKHADKEIKRCNAILAHRHNDEISQALAAKPEPFGKVEVPLTSNHLALDYSVTKKVDWDQTKLHEIAKKIVSEWEGDPAEYMKVSYTVSETAYKSWPTPIKKMFEPARTVKPGTVSIKVVDKAKDA